MQANILKKYVLKESLTYFFICLLSFSSLILTVRILKFATLIINKGVHWSQVAKVIIAIIPTFLEFAIPMSALLGVMLAFARMSGDSEIIVIRATGISLKQMLSPVVIYSLLTLTLALFISYQLRPWGYSTLSNTIFDIARNKTTATLEGGVFNNMGALTLYSETINHGNGDLSNVLVDDRRDEKGRKIISAKSGSIQTNNEERSIEFLLFDGIIHEEREGNSILTDFKTNQISIDPNELYGSKNKRRKKHREKSSAQINSELSLLKAGNKEKVKNPKKQTTDLLIEKGRRVSMPFASLILALIGMPLGIQPPRSQKAWGAGLSIFLGLGVFIIYYGLLSIGIALAESNTLPPLISLWVPNFILGVMAIVFLKKMNSEKWQSVAELPAAILRFGNKVLQYFLGQAK